MTDHQERVHIAVDGGTMNGFVCRPDVSERRPAIIVIHEIFGPEPHHEEVACRFAGEGYIGLSPNLFWNMGPLPDFSDRESFMRFRSSMDDRAILQSLDATLDWLRQQPYVDADHIGIVGFCMGGYYSLLEAIHNSSLSACVDFYGAPLVNPEPTEQRPDSIMDAVKNLKVPFLGFFGAEDQSIPPDQVKQLEQVLESLDVPSDVVVYPNAGHAFFNDTRPSYREGPAQDSWATMIQFFSRYLGS